MKKILLALLLACTAIGSSSCTDDEKSRETLEKYGFTNVNVGGYSYFECGDDYTYATKFTAKNPQGMMVNGTVCCGILKGCSIKF